METWDAIRARRDVRAFEDRPLTAEALDRILEAGRRAPSSQNRQRWDFVVCTDRGQLGDLAAAGHGGARHVATSAATVALVAPAAEGPGQELSIAYDLGQVTINMMLAAADLGIGSGHASVRHDDIARRVLGLPGDRTCRWLVPFGYPAGRPLRPISRPDRRRFDEVVHRGGW